MISSVARTAAAGVRFTFIHRYYREGARPTDDTCVNPHGAKPRAAAARANRFGFYGGGSVVVFRPNKPECRLRRPCGGAGGRRGGKRTSALEFSTVDTVVLSRIRAHTRRRTRAAAASRSVCRRVPCEPHPCRTSCAVVRVRFRRANAVDRARAISAVPICYSPSFFFSVVFVVKSRERFVSIARARTTAYEIFPFFFFLFLYHIFPPRAVVRGARTPLCLTTQWPRQRSWTTRVSICGRTNAAGTKARADHRTRSDDAPPPSPCHRRRQFVAVVAVPGPPGPDVPGVRQLRLERKRSDRLVVGALGATRPPGQVLGGYGALVVPARRAQGGVPADRHQQRPRVPRVPQTGQAGRRARAVGQRAASSDHRVRLSYGRRRDGRAPAVAVLQERRQHGRVLRGGGQGERPVRSRPVPLRSRTARRPRAQAVHGRQSRRRVSTMYYRRNDTRLLHE